MAGQKLDFDPVTTTHFLNSCFHHVYQAATGEKGDIEHSIDAIKAWLASDSRSSELLRVHGLAVPLVDIMRDQGLDLSEDNFPADLIELYRRRVVGDMAQKKTYGELLQKLVSEDISPIVVQKGFWLANKVYPKSYWRGYADLDLLVDDGEMFAVDRVIREQQFKAMYSALPGRQTLPEWTNRKVVDALEYQRDFYNVDVHFNLIPHVFPNRLTMDAVWRGARQEELKIDDLLLPLYRLSPHHTIAHLAMHANCHNLETGYRGLLDVALTLHYFRGNWDWERFYHRCRRCDIGYLVAGPLEMMRCLLFPLGNVIPSDLVSRLGTPAKMVARFYDNVMIERFALSPHSLAEGKRDFWTPLIGAGRQRIYQAARHHLFPEQKRMAARYGLNPGDPKLLLYYLFRPAKLVGKYLPSILKRQN